MSYIVHEEHNVVLTAEEIIALARREGYPIPRDPDPGLLVDGSSVTELEIRWTSERKPPIVCEAPSS